MIICKLKGGLGNQMFQYAAGRSLAVTKGQDLYLEISSFSENQPGVTQRKFMLDYFNINARLIEDDKIFKWADHATLVQKIINKFTPIHRKQIYTHPDFDFDHNFFKTRKNVNIDGYWQSYLYFEKFNELILKEFSIREQFKAKILANDNYFENKQSVSLHLRRGDYVTNTYASGLLRTLPITYYEKAIGYINERVKNPHYYIFSDDPEWARSNMNVPNSTIVESKNELIDFSMMSECTHNIIANSSFSWWAAWLNINVNKIVIAPKNWFNDPSIKTNDLIPPEWIRL